MTCISKNYLHLNELGCGKYVETTKIIRSPDSGIDQKQIPIIALTALAMPEDAAICLKAGMNRYLSKPVIPEKLIKAIAEVLDV